MSRDRFEVSASHTIVCYCCSFFSRTAMVFACAEQEILKNLHFVDNSLPNDKDPWWKLRSIIDVLQYVCLDAEVYMQSCA